MPTPARTVADQLAALGVTVPRLLTEELAVLDACIAYTPPQPPDINLASLKITAKEIAALIEEHVDALIRRDTTNAAKGELRDRLERRATRALATIADEIQTALASVFDKAAAGFTTAYRKLPPEWQNAERLVQSTEHVAALITAKEHVPTLDACRNIHRALPDRPDSPHHQGTAYCSVTDTVVAEEVARTTSSQGPLGIWGNYLATPGVIALQWHRTPQDHATYLASVDVFEMRQVRENESGFGGHQIKKVRVA